MPGKMTDLIVKETSGVDHPAHLHEGFLVMKAADRNRAEVVLSAFGGKKEPQMTEQVKTAALTVEDIQKAVASELQPILDQLATGWKALRDFAEKEDAEVPSTETPATDPTADPTVAAAAATDMNGALMKSAPEAVVKAIEAQRAELVKAREDFQKERDIRLDNEAITLSKATYPNLGLPDETVKALRRVEVSNPELGETLKSMLVSANAQLDGSPLLGELGTTQTIDKSVGTAAEVVEAKAKALVADGKYDTIQKAKAFIFETDADLAARIREEV